MPINKTDLKFYLTHIDPLQEQDFPFQSVGGYPSTTEAFRYSTLASYRDRNDSTLSVTESLGAVQHVLINDEVIKVSGTGTTLTCDERGSRGTVARAHAAGERVVNLGVLDLFGNDFSGSLKQYRCLALQNTSETDIAYDVSVYLKYPSLNEKSSLKLAVEIPSNDAYVGTVGHATTLSLTDPSLPAQYKDDALAGALVTFTSGTLIGLHAVVVSYDKETTTITFGVALPSAPLAGVGYKLSAGPSQRVLNGETKPVTGGDLVSLFTAATRREDSQTIDVHGNRVHSNDLYPADVIYIWLERSLSKNADDFDDNRAILSVRCSRGTGVMAAFARRGAR